MNSLNILVVDDDRDLAGSLAILLEIEGHGATLAYNARQALARHNDERFDLVFMDIRLPDRSGLECLPEIRRLHPAADVILMTAYAVPDALARAREDGALGVVRKPLDVEELSRLLSLLAGGVIAVADETPEGAGRLAEALAARGHDAIVVGSVERAGRAAREDAADVVILDLTPRPVDTRELAGAFGERRDRVPLVVLAGRSSTVTSTRDGQPFMSITECFTLARGAARIVERVERIRSSHE